MTYSIILKSQLEGAHRLDAEYYQPEYLKVSERLKSGTRLMDLSEQIICGPFGSTMLADTYIPGGTVVIRPFNLDGFNSDRGDLVSIPSEDIPIKGLKTFQNGDLFFARVGEITTGIAHNFSDYVTISPNIIAAKLNKNKVDSYFLIAFLNTKYGYLQLERDQRTVAQPTISTQAVKDMVVFLPTSRQQEQIADLVRSAFDQDSQSREVYIHAEDTLLDELGLRDFAMKDELAYVVHLSDVKAANRLDAEYFQPKYSVIEDILITNFNAKKIGALDFIEVTTGQYCEEYVTENDGRPYIRGTDLSRGTVVLDNLVYISQDRQIESKKAREGDVVVTRVGTIGIAARLPKEVECGTTSDNLIRLRITGNTLDPYFTSVFLNSVGSLLMIRESRGSVQPRLNQETLKEVILPILPNTTQQKIADLVRKSHEARKRSKELLEEAKRRVEELIEKEATRHG